MSCLFCARGDDFDVDAFLQQYSLTPYAKWCRGTERRPGKPYEFSGFTFVASEAPMEEFEKQIADAIAFLGTHASWLSAIATFPGVEDATLDFGIAMPGGYIPMVSFPPALVSAAGSFGLWLATSFY